VVSARLVLEQFNLADQDPRLIENDRIQREFFRGLFDTLWTPAAQ
jgi:hypothetical protein